MENTREESVRAIIQEEFGDAKFIIRENGDEGFECRKSCSFCEYHTLAGCNYDKTNKDIRRVNGGVFLGGECYEFYSLEQFWDTFSNTHYIDPETGEIVEIY